MFDVLSSMFDLLSRLLSRWGIALISFVAGCGFITDAYMDRQHHNDVMARGAETRAVVALDGAVTQRDASYRRVTLTWLDQQRRPRVSRVKVSETWFQSAVQGKRTEPVSIRYVSTLKSKPVVLGDVSFAEAEIWRGFLWGLAALLVSAIMTLWILFSAMGRAPKQHRST